MKRLITAIIMAFGLFTIIPMPKIWDEKAGGLMILVYPVVGAAVGIIWYGTALLATWLGINTMLVAILVMLMPFFVTGFIHMDGFMDTADSLFSRRDLAEKLRILKDPHVGSFGVLGAIIVFMAGFAGIYVFLANSGLLIHLIFIPICSRLVVGAFIFFAPALSTGGYGEMYKSTVKKTYGLVLGLVAIAMLAAAVFFLGIPVALVILGPCLIEVLAGILAGAVLLKNFSGISGDLCGFILVISELCGVLALGVL